MMQPGRKFSSANGYRYGFNGQEKDNENAGEGNSYTAEFWQYDSRIGRRWNIDPKARLNRSCYETFSGNPIVKIDPNGNDDFWSIDKKTGKAQLIRQDGGTTHDIRVQVGDKFLKLSELNIDWKDDKMINGLSDIVATYVSIANIKFNYNCEHEEGSFEGGAGVANGTLLGKNANALAFFNHEDESMYLNVVNGKIAPKNDDAYNLISSFQHENRHKENFINKKNDNIENTFADHTDVYIFQLSQDVFSKTTDAYKLAMTGSAINHYLNALTGGGPEKRDSDERVKKLKIDLDAALKKNGMYFKITREFDERSPLEFIIYDSKTNEELTGTMYYEELKTTND